MSPGRIEPRVDTVAAPSLEQLARACAPGPGDIVFISGSRVEGFGNAESDYDIYVIQREKGQARPFVTLVLDRSYVVYEMLSHAQVVRIAETLNAADASDFTRLWSLSWFELELYYRVLVGRGLVNEPALAELKTRFHKHVIDACVRTWCGLRAVVHLEEAERKAASGRPKSAYSSAQQAMSSALDSSLAEHGESYPGLKWRFEKLRRLSGESDAIYRRAWDLKSLGARSIAEYLGDVKAFCAEVGMGAFRAWSSGDVPCRPIPTARLVTVHGVPYVVDNKNVVYELTPDAARVWSWMNGAVPRRDLVERAARETAMSRGEADELLATLVRLGLVV